MAMAAKVKVLLSEFYFALVAPDGAESDAVAYGEFCMVRDRMGTLWGATAEAEDETPATYRMTQAEHVIEGDYEFTGEDGEPLPPPDGVEVEVEEEEEGEPGEEDEPEEGDEEEEGEEGIVDEDAATADDSDDNDEDDAA